MRTTLLDGIEKSAGLREAARGFSSRIRRAGSAIGKRLRRPVRKAGKDFLDDAAIKAESILDKAMKGFAGSGKKIGRDAVNGATERTKEILMNNRGKIIGTGLAVGGGAALIDVARSKFLANEIAKKMQESK